MPLVASSVILESWGNNMDGHTPERLKQLQALPLERKVGFTVARLIEFYQHFNGKVYVSFSGGKDSTVLLYIARKIFPLVFMSKIF